MRALVMPQVDSVARAGDPCQERLHELVLVPDEREDRAVVVGIGMDVEDLGVPAESVASASIVAASRPSEKFGTDSSGRGTRVL